MQNGVHRALVIAAALAQSRAMQIQLYRQFNADGQLLYVGISADAVQRQRQHKSISAWAGQVDRVEVVTYANRAAALRAETWVIGTEQPRYNQRKQQYLPMTNAEVGKAVGFSLEEAYRLARKGDILQTIEPVEFSTMTRDERRHHMRIMKRLARGASGPTEP